VSFLVLPTTWWRLAALVQQVVPVVHPALRRLVMPRVLVPAVVANVAAATADPVAVATARVDPAVVAVNVGPAETPRQLGKAVARVGIAAAARAAATDKVAATGRAAVSIAVGRTQQQQTSTIRWRDSNAPPAF
jgi:hypothetical protein